MSKNKEEKHCGTCAQRKHYDKVWKNNDSFLRGRCKITNDEVFRDSPACKYHSGGDLSKEGYRLAKEAEDV